MNNQSKSIVLAILALACSGCGMVKMRSQTAHNSPPDLLDATRITGINFAELKAKSAGASEKTVSHDSAVTKTQMPTAAASTPGANAASLAPHPAPGSLPGLTAASTPVLSVPVARDSVIPVQGRPYPLDLTTSLRLADGQNPVLAEARVAILEALAIRTQARALLVPTLNAGMNYHGHDGDLQRSSGRILRVSSQSFYIGGGARTLAAETVAIPAVNISTPLTDALYEPLAAQQRVARAEYQASATANSVLLDVSRLFIELLGAEATLEVRRISAAEAAAIVKSVNDYAATGQGRKADADRAATELGLLQGEVQHAEEMVAVASARLSERLNLDAATRLETVTGPLEPIELIDANQPIESLIQTAIVRRPDLAARTASIGEAQYRLKEEKARPLLPTLWLGFSGGAFGGGSNFVPPLMSHFGGRTDFDVRATWTLLNFGAGNASLIKRRRAELGAADAERARTLNTVRTEVTAAKAEAMAQLKKVEIARAELASSQAGFREDFQRLRETVGLPIEVIDSLKLLAGARVNLVEAITKSNQAQLSLFVSLGTPPPLDPSSTGPVAEPPIANPLHSPITYPQPEPTPHTHLPGPPLLGK